MTEPTPVPVPPVPASPTPPPPPPGEGRTGGHWIERAVALAVAVWIIGLLSFLILSQREYDPTSVYFLKILLAFSIAILVATSAGFINLEFNLAGIALRAGGAIAVFIFVYTQSPSVPALGLVAPKIEMNKVGAVDFRALKAPSDPMFADSPIAITARIELKNIKDQSRTGTLKRTDILLRSGKDTITYQWFYFVRLLPGVAGTWLSSGTIREARSQDLAPGVTFSEEVMHLAQKGPSWKTFVDILKEAKEPIVLQVNAEVDGKLLESECRFNAAPYNEAIAKLESAYKRLPGYVSVICEQ